MDFPTLVYKKGGVHQMKGGTYSYKGAADAEAFAALIADGWYPSMVEMIDGGVITKQEKAEVVDEVSPPTRAELEAKAKELGLKFDGRTGDKKLSDMIDKALS